MEWKIADPKETLKIFCNTHEEKLVPGIEEDKFSTSEPEDKLPVHVIPYEGESVKPNEN